MRRELISKIDSILGSVEQQVRQGVAPELHLITTGSKRKFDDARAQYVEATTRRRLRLFSTNANEAKMFVVYIRMFKVIQEALNIDQVVNKRDVYYQDVELFQSQDVVDRALMTVALTLGTTRNQLNVVATSKGMVHGDMTLFGKNGVVAELDGSSAHTIPSTPIVSVRLASAVDYILVVEKDAVFKQCIRPNAICITGKGFPDIATRRILNLLSQSYPDIAIYGLVDSDPSGMQILACYKFGSPQMGSENAQLVCPRLQFLGVSILEYKQGTVPLTWTDRRLAKSMLQQPWMGRAATRAWKRELQLGLFLGKKAELNVVDQFNIGRYLDSKLL